MSALNFIPHSLCYLEAMSDGFEDENGDWHEGSEVWSEPIPCHAVQAGQANVITYDDGSTVTYSYTIGRLDPDCREFKVGEEILLHVDGTSRRLQVKGFHRWQLQSKIWV